MILHKEKIIHIHIPRTAGTSMEVAFGSNKLRDHRDKKDYLKIISKEEWNQYFKFSFVRNPWDRIVSMYCGKNQTISFAEWCKNISQIIKLYKYPTQTDWLFENGELIVDFLGKFENLQKDFKQLCKLTNNKNMLPHINKNKRQHYKKYYTSKEIDLIYPFVEKDLKAFNYLY